MTDSILDKKQKNITSLSAVTYVTNEISKNKYHD